MIYIIHARSSVATMHTLRSIHLLACLRMVDSVETRRFLRSHERLHSFNCHAPVGWYLVCSGIAHWLYIHRISTRISRPPISLISPCKYTHSATALADAL